LAGWKARAITSFCDLWEKRWCRGVLSFDNGDVRKRKRGSCKFKREGKQRLGGGGDLRLHQKKGEEGWDKSSAAFEGKPKKYITKKGGWKRRKFRHMNWND